jgi:hypothetical protein
MSTWDGDCRERSRPDGTNARHGRELGGWLPPRRLGQLGCLAGPLVAGVAGLIAC